MTRGRREHPCEEDEQRQPDELDPARDLDPRRRAGGRFTLSIVLPAAGPRQPRPPGLGLELAEDGSLALDAPTPGTIRGRNRSHRRRLPG